MLTIDILTLFPEMFTGFMSESIIGRAQAEGLVKINLINFREFTLDKHRHVDDTPYGGGAGMVLKCQPIFDALKTVEDPNRKVIMMTPQGQKFSQNIAFDLAKESHLVFICGHYEGFDERIRSKADMELSIGDYVLTGGELPSMVVCDSIIRLLNGAITEESYRNDSHANGILEAPQYTKPDTYEGMKVPLVLANGNHALINKWRKKEALRNTYLKRPDLLENYEMDKEEKKLFAEILEEESNK